MKNSNKIVQHLCYKLIKMLFGQSTIFGNKNQWPTDVNAGKKKYITEELLQNETQMALAMSSFANGHGFQNECPYHQTN